MSQLPKYSIFKQRELNRWFEMFVVNQILDKNEYHEFCKWVKGKKQKDVFNLIHRKQRPYSL